MDYTLGIVTYHARFEKYFIPLIKNLTRVFPDKEILCIINGHPDQILQDNYLRKVVKFLSQFPNIRYVTYDQHQSLAKCWNQLIILSDTEKILIMNDDTQITDLFRQEFEKNALNKIFSTLNVSWSHFLISKEIIKKVGWFDERLLGVGYEDFDYVLRMTIENIPVTNTMCLGINNYVVKQDNPGWKNISEKVSNSKYSLLNTVFFKEKWNAMEFVPGSRPEDFQYLMHWNDSKDSVYPFSPKNHQPTPLFYDYSLINTKNKTDVKYFTPYKKNNFKIVIQKMFYTCRLFVKKIYRSIVN